MGQPRPSYGLTSYCWCPRWDSNPHWTGFESVSSASWDTRALGEGFGPYLKAASHHRGSAWSTVHTAPEFAGRRCSRHNIGHGRPHDQHRRRSGASCPDRRRRSPHPTGPGRNAARGGLRNRRRSRRRPGSRRTGRTPQAGPGDHGCEDAAPRRNRRCVGDSQQTHRADRGADRVQPARPGRTRPRRRCDGLPGEALHHQRLDPGHRVGRQPLQRDHRAGARSGDVVRPA